MTITSASPKEVTATLSNASQLPYTTNLPGDPDCPICGGIGYIRSDLPIDHPDFGKLVACQCRQAADQEARQQQVYATSNLHAFQHMVFDTFEPQGHVGLGEEQQNSLRVAYNQAKHFAVEQKGWLVMNGGYGCGKTHLAAAIANQVAQRGEKVIFLTVPDLLDWLRFSYNGEPDAFERRFNELRTVNMLVLDDLGTQNATPWAQEKLFQIINSRYLSLLPTVITTNQNIDEIDGRVQSRLLDPELVTLVKITAPDYRNPLRENNEPRVSTLSLYAHRTFTSFNLREHEKLSSEETASLKKALQTGEEYAQQPRGWLLLMGGYATGKTHLAAAIANYRQSQGESPMLVVVPDLLDHLRATFNPNSPITYDTLFNQVRSTRLLVLDDLGTQSATPWAMEKLYQIINYRYEAELPTVITTAFELKDIHPRIRSRMIDARLCRILALIAPPYQGNLQRSNKKR